MIRDPRMMQTCTLVLLLLPLVLASSIDPTVKPKVKVDSQGRVSFAIQDEPGNLVEVIVTMDVNKNFHVGKAIKNSETNEWTYRTSHYKLKSGDKVQYMISYIFNTVEDSVRTYKDVFHVGQDQSSLPAPHQLRRRESTVLYDDFNSGSINRNNWDYDITAAGGGNGEFQVYSPESQNSFVRNGILYLKPTFTADKFGENFMNYGHLDVKAQWGSCTNNMEGGCYRSGHEIPPIMSAKLFSKKTIRHGRVEVLAQIPKGDWIWPAIWLLPPNGNSKYGGWPMCGEIDIMESRGNLDLKDAGGNIQGVSQVLSTIHYGKSWQGSGHRSQSHWRLSSNGKTWADDYHLYAVDWTEDHIRATIDGNPVLSWNTPSEGYWKHEGFTGNNIWASGNKDAPFDTNFYLILNVAVGGNRGFFPDDWNNAGGKPWRDSSASAMRDFWNNRHSWQKTWHGDDVAMKIKYVKMVQY